LKRLVAKRKLRRTCTECGKGFEKGEVYYKHREVFVEDGIMYGAYEYLKCPKCVNKEINRMKRFKNWTRTHSL